MQLGIPRSLTILSKYHGVCDIRAGEFWDNSVAVENLCSPEEMMSQCCTQLGAPQARLQVVVIECDFSTPTLKRPQYAAIRVLEQPYQQMHQTATAIQLSLHGGSRL